MTYDRQYNGEYYDLGPFPDDIDFYSQFVDLIETQGFTITDSWGGYGHETYGEGGELVIAFRSSAQGTEP